MTATSLLITRLRPSVAAWARESSGVLSVELFGSAVDTAKPRDVDLLVVYDPEVTTPLIASQEIRPSLRKAVSPLIDVPTDITLMTPTERREPGFPWDAGSLRPLWGPTPLG